MGVGSMKSCNEFATKIIFLMNYFGLGHMELKDKILQFGLEKRQN